MKERAIARAIEVYNQLAMLVRRHRDVHQPFVSRCEHYCLSMRWWSVVLVTSMLARLVENQVYTSEML
jgi:hypothetical protein